ncbi:hypothetical protein [Candidatus Nanohalococcus occultus]|uniref:hypothetical protein n=1 Tax=Candidatus Nanohalococcus occultus TaxID=2978047 RepID=UPI0039DFA799
MTHKGNRELHRGPAVAGLALGALTGYSKEGKNGVAAGAALGGLAGLLAGRKALDTL